MHQITLTFQAVDEYINGRFVTARGLHGMLFHTLKEADPAEANWMHKHPAPKPFSLVPLYTEEGALAGVRVAALTERAAVLLLRAWEWRRDQGAELHLGKQYFTVSDVACAEGPTWIKLTRMTPGATMQLQFLSPTAFKQGPGHLPLPLPYNVFSWPARVWEAYGPPRTLPEGWIAWCEQNVFVVSHQIETATVNISRRETFTGFVGVVDFEAHQGSDAELAAWQALGQLAAFSGVGHKTTMGMGAVEMFNNPNRRA